jgi:hypothetical protein
MLLFGEINKNFPIVIILMVIIASFFYPIECIRGFIRSLSDQILVIGKQEKINTGFL